jgi:hypothetical protein
VWYWACMAQIPSQADILEWICAHTENPQKEIST